jgi:hypothetical protein
MFPSLNYSGLHDALINIMEIAPVIEQGIHGKIYCPKVFTAHNVILEGGICALMDRLLQQWARLL